MKTMSLSTLKFYGAATLALALLSQAAPAWCGEKKLDPGFLEFVKASELCEHNQNEAALPHVNKALALNPRDPEALSLRAGLYIDSDRLAEALKDLDLSLKLSPKLYRSLSRRGYVYLALGRRKEGIVDLLKVVKSDYVDAIDQSPDTDYLNLSKAYKSAAMNEEAAKCFKLSRAFAPLETAQALRAQFRMKEAKTIVDEVVRCHPESSYARLLAGVICMDMGLFAESVKHFSVVLERHPDFVPAYYFRAESYRGLGKSTQALADYDRALSQNSRYIALSYTAGTGRMAGTKGDLDIHPVLAADVRFLKADLLLSEKKYAEAQVLLKDYMKERPADGAGYLALSNLEIKLQHFAAAEEYCRKAIALSPRDWHVYQALVEIYKTAGKSEAALKAASQMVELGGEDSDVYYVRSQLYNSLKKYDLALKDLSRIIAAGDGDAETYVGRAQVYLSLKMGKEALSDYEKAVHLDSSYKSSLPEFTRRCSGASK